MSKPQPVKFKIDVFFACNGEAQPADEAEQLKYIACLRDFIPPTAATLVDEYGGSYQHVYWATLEEELAKFSRAYPDLILGVYYDGSEVEMGVQFFHRGQFYFAEAQIVYPKFEAKALPPLPPQVHVIVYDGNFAGILGLPPEYVVSSIALDSDATDEYYMCRQGDKPVLLCSYHLGEQMTDPKRTITEIVYGPFAFGPCPLCPH